MSLLKGWNKALQRWYHWTDDHFSLLFWPVFIGACFLAFVIFREETNLKNKIATHDMVSLEWGASDARDTAIIQSWKKDSVDQLSGVCCAVNSNDNSNKNIYQKKKSIDKLALAKQDVQLDYVFIFFYTLLIIITVIKMQRRYAPHSRATGILVTLALVAGLCDAIENIGVLGYIEDGIGNRVTPHAMNALAITGTSIIKSVLLAGFLFIYLPYVLLRRAHGFKYLSAYIKNKSHQLYRYRVILIGVIIFSIPIWMLDQGQDLLIDSNASVAGAVLFIVVIMITAFLNWYLSKLFFNTHYKGPILPVKAPDPDDPKTNPSSEKNISRFLGVATIIIPAVGILQATQAIKISSWMSFFPPEIWVVFFLGSFYFLVKSEMITRCFEFLFSKFGAKKSKRITIGILIFLSAVVPGVIRFVILGNDEAKTPPALYFLFWHMMLLAFSFVIFVTLREKIFKPGSWLGINIGLPVILSAGLLVLFFLLVNFFTALTESLDADFLSLPVFLSGIVFYIMFFTILIRLSQWKKINFLLFIFVAGLLLSMHNNTFHDVRQTKAASSVKPVPLNEYFKNWLLAREKEINESGDNEFPVFLVNTYGGGIRASAFTSLTIAYLDSILIEKGMGHKAFEHYVFSISGASGGTIGAAVQCAYRHRYLDTGSSYSSAIFLKFYQHDFLTPVLSGMAGRDVWASASGTNLWGDRSEIQEHIWTYYARKGLGIQMDSNFFSFWDTSASNRARYEVPLLFSNTLNIDDGLKGICSPVALTQAAFPATSFINERLDSMKTISLITGAFLSARFPFISPDGKMGPGYHFMDGGAKDNSGAGTSENIFVSLAKYARSVRSKDSTFSHLLRKVRFYFLSLSNTPYTEPDDRQLVSDRFELLSPLTGIINSAIDGNARAADSMLQYRYGSDTLPYMGIKTGYCSVWPLCDCIELSRDVYYSPVLPLGWQISAPSLARLHQSFDVGLINRYDTIGIKKILRIFHQ